MDMYQYDYGQYVVPYVQVKGQEQCGQGGKSGLQVSGRFRRDDGGGIVMQMQVKNCTQQEISDFAVQLNKNSFGVSVQGWDMNV